MNDFNDISKKYPQVIISPYEYCILKSVMGSIYAIQDVDYGEECTLGLFFEAGQDVRQRIRNLFHNAVKNTEVKIVDISFVKKGNHTPLQFADMVAWSVLKAKFGKSHFRNTLFNSVENVGAELKTDLIKEDFKVYAKILT